MPMKSPHPHQRLDRNVEGAPGSALEFTGLREDRPQVQVHAHALPARPAVQLAQVARRVEQAEPALHPPQLGERCPARIQPFLL